MKMAGHPTVIYHAASAQQAALLRNLLEERGIAAWVDNDLIQGAAGELPLGWAGSARVVVQEKDAVEARQFALQFDERSHDVEPALDDETESYEVETWKDWLRCPQCGEQRHTRCPLCGGAGIDYPLVDLETTEHGDRVLLLCRDCDEHFRPTFYRVCHRCGFDYGSGIQSSTPSPRTADGANTRRVWIAAAVMGGGLLVLMVYFAWLLNR